MPPAGLPLSKGSLEGEKGYSGQGFLDNSGRNFDISWHFPLPITDMEKVASMQAMLVDNS